MHIKRKHKGGNKSDRERYAREIFLALKNNKQLPSTTLTVPENFMKTIQDEFNRLKKIDFEEEFDPSNLFRYNISNFEEIMASHSHSEGEDFEDIASNADSISVSVNRGDIKNDCDSQDQAADEQLSILSGAKSEGVGRREPLQQIMKEIQTKKSNKDK